MALEIERKFLVVSDAWRCDRAGVPLSGVRFRQGYIPGSGETAVRVRLEGERGVLTIKALTASLARLEYEYSIPASDALEMLDNVCSKPQIDKIRYCIDHGAHTWDVDEFLGENGGLIVAEIELGDEHEIFERPVWVGEEVTQDTRYLNVNLAKHPYRAWDLPNRQGINDK